MGWSCTTHVPESAIQACRDEFGSNYEILADAMVGSTYYAAVKHLRPEWKGRVFGAVTLTKRGRYEGRPDFCTKGMDEGMGPCEATAPAKVLNLLSPLEDPTGRDKHAADWRQRCRDNLERKRTKLKLVDGMKVSTAEPLDYGAIGKIQHFTVKMVKSGRKMRTCFTSEKTLTLLSIRPRSKETLMLTTDFYAKEAAERAAAAASTRDAVLVVEDERELEPMF